MLQSIRRFRAICRAGALACLLAMMASAAGAAQFTYNKLSYSNADTIEPGRWTCRFAKAKSYADAKNVPLVVVWANTGCSYCRTFETSVGGSADVAAWCQKRGYVFVFALGGADSSRYGMNASDVSSASRFSRYLGVTLNAYPFVGVYWKKNRAGRSVKANFVGRTSYKDPKTGDQGMPVKTGSFPQRFMDSVDSLVGDFADQVKLSVAAEPATAGQVTGDGVFSPGDTVTVKATARSGSFFAGWYDGGRLLSQRATYTHTLGKAATTLTARFVTPAEDLASVALAANDVALATTAAGLVPTNVLTCGVQVDWPLAASALTEPTAIAVRGLPAGLKLVKDKATGTFSLAGVPTTASRTDAKTGRVKASIAQLTVTTRAKSKQTFPLAFVIAPLPAWAVGTFNGGGGEGQVTATVSAAGKFSGKYLANGQTWTLSATGYRTFSDETGGAFDVVAKSGRTVVTNAVAVGPSVAADETRGMLACESFMAYQNLWKLEPRKTFAKTVAKSAPLVWSVIDAEGHEGTLTLTFSSAGAVRAKGVFVVGENARGKPVTYSAATAAVLCAQGGDAYSVFVYLPPRTGKFAGYVEQVDLVWDGQGFVRQQADLQGGSQK